MVEPGSERLDLALGQDARQRQKTVAVERIAFGPRQRIVAHASRSAASSAASRLSRNVYRSVTIA